MWVCPKCSRVFTRSGQPHSCRSVPLENHFIGKTHAKDIFYHLLERINNGIGKCRIISIPCCIHLFGNYDFLAALPRKDRLEIRFALNRVPDDPEPKTSIPISSKSYKLCFDLGSNREVNEALLSLIGESYHLRAGDRRA